MGSFLGVLVGRRDCIFMNYLNEVEGSDEGGWGGCCRVVGSRMVGNVEPTRDTGPTQF